MEKSTIINADAEGKNNNPLMVLPELSPLEQLTKRCRSAINLVRKGRDKDAKEMFPFEYYLAEKYLFLSSDNFS